MQRETLCTDTLLQGHLCHTLAGRRAGDDNRVVVVVDAEEHHDIEDMSCVPVILIQEAVVSIRGTEITPVVMVLTSPLSVAPPPLPPLCLLQGLFTKQDVVGLCGSDTKYSMLVHFVCGRMDGCMSGHITRGAVACLIPGRIALLWWLLLDEARGEYHGILRDNMCTPVGGH